MNRAYAVCVAIGTGLFLATQVGVVRGQSVEEFDSVSPEVSRETTPDRGPGPRADVSAVAETIVERTNAFRRKKGLPALEQDSELTAAAKYFADFMARTQKYGHRADGKRPAERAKEHGYEYCLVLENISYAYRSTGFDNQQLAQRFLKVWKNSERHRENMLDEEVHDTGVAVSRSEDVDTQYFAVQMFGRPRSKAIEFQISNASGQQVEYTVNRKNFARTFTLPPRLSRTHWQCRPSLLDLGWTQEDDKIAVRDDRKFVVREGSSEEGLQVEIAKVSEGSSP